ncbi:MAG: DUF4260 domain-containing protein [Acidimicrobiia bacterium]
MLSLVAIQRVEGAALLVFAVVVFALSDLSWRWFALLLLIPDLCMLGYLANDATGAAVYNVGHTMVWPMGLLAWGLAADQRWPIGIGAIWLAHIGMDRALGYGLKLADGFKHTHLGWIGRPGRRPAGGDTPDPHR